MDTHVFDNGRLTARVTSDGAELCSLRDAEGGELLWQAGPAWPRHAPVLFPIVGRLKDDRLQHDGASYRMTQHGFARDRRFDWIEREAQSCRLRLTDDEESRALYPFAFALELAFTLEGASLEIRHSLSNPGPESLPASLGVHPAFRWPLREDTPKTAHELTFAEPEPGPIRRVAGGLLLEERFPTPVEGRRLALDEALFAADALILERPASRSLRYGAPGGPAIIVSWEGFDSLGIWSKPGGDFLCIEPWRGYASPEGFEGSFHDKPGLMHVPPGEERVLSYRITVD